MLKHLVEPGSSAAPSSPPARARRRPGPKDAGYVLVTAALLLVPLMAFVGLSVDVGSWYARASRLQRAADASALAGAARMPDFATATAVAKATATKNGFTTGANITVNVVRAGERKITVTIADSDVSRFFTSIFLSNMSLQRSATAEYVLPVPLGSPTALFGNDPSGGDPGTAVTTVGLWGNIHGTATDDVKGDRYAAGCRNASNCATTQNPEYRAEGYTYTLDVPTGAHNVKVQVYDAGLYDRGDNEQVDTGDRMYTRNSNKVTTNWEMFDADDTLLDNTDNPSLAGSSKCGIGLGKWDLVSDNATDATMYKNKWATICDLGANPTPGRYLLRVKTTGPGDGANRFSLRASYTGTRPQLAAFGDMSMFNNQLSVNPEFYLAEVDQIHRGKTFVIDLYDPGEIGVPAAKMNVLDPSQNGNTGGIAPTCTVKVFTNPTDTTPESTTNYNSGCSIQTTDSGGGALFNGKLLEISVPIPTTYTCNSAVTNPGCWWKIRYNLGGATSGSPADTTTWSAYIKGDPVHLISN